MRLKGIVLVAGAALLLIAATACEQSKPAPAGEQPTGAAAGKTTKPAAAAAIPEGGTKHDPPIKPDKVAEGHWYCEMAGTVHYSSTNKGTGKCPICKMALKHKGAGGDEHAH